MTDGAGNTGHNGAWLHSFGTMLSAAWRFPATSA
jgi:hypothetical protein